MKVDYNLCLTDPGKYRLCTPHICVRVQDSCDSQFSASFTAENNFPTALVIGLTIGSLFLFSFLATLMIIWYRRRKQSYHKEELDWYSLDIDLHECGLEADYPRNSSSVSKQSSSMPKNDYKLIPMLNDFPKVHKSRSEVKAYSMSSQKSTNANSRIYNSNIASIVLPKTSMSARQQYRLVPERELPARIYKNPAHRPIPKVQFSLMTNVT